MESGGQKGVVSLPYHPASLQIPTGRNFPFFFFLPCCMACGILVPPPGIRDRTRAPAVKALSPNHWTLREFPGRDLPCISGRKWHFFTTQQEEERFLLAWQQPSQWETATTQPMESHYTSNSQFPPQLEGSSSQRPALLPPGHWRCGLVQEPLISTWTSWNLSIVHLGRAAVAIPTVKNSLNRNIFFVFFFSFFFGWAMRLMGSQFPDQGSNPYPLQWKHGALTTGPPGNFLQQDFKQVFIEAPTGGQPWRCKSK